MSSFVLMKVFESAPNRYDWLIKVATLGKIGSYYSILLEKIEKGEKVLDIGCGTGMLTLAAAQKGAFVVGIDINPSRLEVAKKRSKALKLEKLAEFKELGVAELESFADQSFDSIMSGLCFSELSPEERNYALDHCIRLLKPGGKLLLADEVIPENMLKRVLYWLIRIPMQILTFILSQATTHAMSDLSAEIKRHNFEIVEQKKFFLDSFQVIIAQKGTN